MKTQIEDYCKNTTVHGLRYTSDSNLPRFVRISWIVISVGSLIFCCFMIYLQFSEFSKHRINTSIASTSYPIWEVPFPAVTLCNFNVVYKDHIEKLSKSLILNGFTNASVMGFFRNLNALVDSDILNNDINIQKYKHIIQYLNSVEYSSDRIMKELAQPCTQMLKKCFWKTKEVNCGTLFRMVRTTSGYCCSFNYLGELDDNEIIDDEDVFIAGGLGLAFGLKVIIDPEISQYVSRIKPLKGLDVSLHDSYDYPIMSLQAITVMPGEDVTVTVRPQMFVSNDEIRTLDLPIRQCLFRDEKKLKMSMHYSYITCFTECKAKAIYNFCNCVPFVYHALESVPYCTLLDTACLKQNSNKYHNLEISEIDLEDHIRNARKKQKTDLIHCNCYPQCNEISYDEEFDVKKTSVSSEYLNMSILNVFYNRIGCTKITRDIYMTWNSVIASVGGLFGLCFGGSVLSLIELIFYISYGITKKLKLKPKKSEEVKLYFNDFQLQTKIGRKRIFPALE